LAQKQKRAKDGAPTFWNRKLVHSMQTMLLRAPSLRFFSGARVGSPALFEDRIYRTDLYGGEKDEPQPQERAEFGLMKLNPWRINVSS
jgi:hypothetical protein